MFAALPNMMSGGEERGDQPHEREHRHVSGQPQQQQQEENISVEGVLLIMRVVVVVVGGDCVVRIATTTNAKKAVGVERCQRTSREAGRP